MSRAVSTFVETHYPQIAVRLQCDMEEIKYCPWALYQSVKVYHFLRSHKQARLVLLEFTVDPDRALMRLSDMIDRLETLGISRGRISFEQGPGVCFHCKHLLLPFRFLSYRAPYEWMDVSYCINIECSRWRQVTVKTQDQISFGPIIDQEDGLIDWAM